MEHTRLVKNISTTICAVGLIFNSSLNTSGTMVVNGDYNPPASVFQDFDVTTSRSSLYKQENWYASSNLSRLDSEVKTIFGYMRAATLEEQESVRNYIRNISVDTGVDFFELC